MQKVVIYTKEGCPYCKMAKELLTEKGFKYQVIAVDNNPAKLAEMVELSGQRSVPQIFINNKPIGGYNELSQLTSDELNTLLKDE
jgi:glutaredoxin 3